jgi:hypothetical protein
VYNMLYDIFLYPTQLSEAIITPAYRRAPDLRV